MLADLYKKKDLVRAELGGRTSRFCLCSRSDHRGQALTTFLTLVEIVSKVASINEDLEKARVQAKRPAGKEPESEANSQDFLAGVERKCFAARGKAGNRTDLCC